MKKFLIVGCGGSGGATLRYLMDQLRADLRPYGIRELPKAWQFLHVDVNSEPEATEGLGTIVDLGGRYYSVSRPGNSYTLVANELEQALGSTASLRELLGWAPAPSASASGVGVTIGAGQYRAVGRMLTLTQLSGLRAEMTRAWGEVVRKDAWGELASSDYPGTFSMSAEVIPIVVGSMAGGSGASMFLDVCRLLGRVPGLSRNNLGVFLYSADVFALSLSDDQRTGVDGNALGAIGELFSAQARSADAVDAEMYAALGIAPETTDQPAFKRVFPIGSSIGGDGEKFGDGSAEGVFRGLGRAIAATMASEQASIQYIKTKVENNTPPTMDQSYLGWGAEASEVAWGSFGYASLSLGRDRYAEYASQRIARVAVDRLTEGHLNPQSQLPSTEQLNALVENQLPTILDRLRLPQLGAPIGIWLNATAVTEHTMTAEAQRAVADAQDALSATSQAQAASFLAAVRESLPRFQAHAMDTVRDSAYTWAEGWSVRLEAAIREEFLREATQLGLPFAIGVARRLSSHLNPVIDRLRQSPREQQALAIDDSLSGMAAGLKRTVVGAGHELANLLARGFQSKAERALQGEAAALAADVLASLVTDVLGGLVRDGSSMLQDLAVARTQTKSEAGLAQLATDVYGEWPQNTPLVPTRFDQADNEILLTTSAKFPAQFEADVTASVPSAGNVSASAVAHIVGEVLIGRWQTAGGVPGDFPVLTTRSEWRPACLPRAAASRDSTPKSSPRYAFAFRTSDVLERAREHLRRPDQPFEKFSSETIEGYLNDQNVGDSDRDARAGELVAKFQETMALARPLVGVSPSMIRKLHPSNALRYQYAFSPIPLSSASAVAAQIQQLMAADASLDPTTVQQFGEALTDGIPANKIAVFGAYPKYSPLVFSSLLDQIDRRWNESPEIALADLWQWKRTRPLTAGLAMSASELRAMIGGWWLGRLLGTIVVPPPGSSDPAQIWDFEGQRWLAFTRRMLTPPTRFRGRHDWLPAILESHSIAIVRSNNDVDLNALAPYVALRQTWDLSIGGPVRGGGYVQLQAVARLSDWLTTGAWPSGQPSTVLGDVAAITAPGTTPEVRAAAVREWLKKTQGGLAGKYLTDGSGVGDLATKRVKVQAVGDLAGAPMYAEIAQISDEVLSDLGKTTDLALRNAATGPGWGTSDDAVEDFLV